MSNLQTLGETLKNRRLNLRYKSKDVAKYIGIAPSSYSKIEQGDLRPNYQQCEKIAEFLQLPAQKIIALAGLYSPILERKFAIAYSVLGEKLITELDRLIEVNQNA